MIEKRYAPLFTTKPSPTTLSVTIGPRQGFRIAFRLLWESLVAALRRDTVTFSAWDETGRPTGRPVPLGAMTELRSFSYRQWIAVIAVIAFVIMVVGLIVLGSIQ